MLSALACLVSGCSGSGPGSADETGVCFRTTVANGKPRSAVLSRGDPNLETCAMHLEVARLMGHRAKISGRYQGELLFVDDRQVIAAESSTSATYNVFSDAQRQDLDAKIAELLKFKKGR